MCLIFLSLLLVLECCLAYEPRPPHPPSPSWHKYVRAPASRDIHPKKVFNITGNVQNPNTLVSGRGVATFERKKTSDPIPALTLDFGQNIVGYPQIAFVGASNNHPGLRLTFSETTEYLTNVSDFTRSDNGDTITPGTDQFAVPSHPYTWTDTHGCMYNGTQVCADGLHGFRYMRIALDALDSDAPHSSPNGTFKVKAASLQFTAFLGSADMYNGYFECSDDQLNQYWFDAAYTNEMCTDHFRASDVDPRDAATPTLEGKLVLQDGAKRDRDPYIGDITVSGRTAYLTHDVAEAAKNVIADLADHQRSDGWIPPASINNYTLPLFDYPLHWVVSSWEYVLYTGDTEYARSYFDNLVAVLDGWYPSVTDENGLLSKGLSGTERYGDYAFLPRTAEVTYYNALYVLALKYAAAWASFLNDGSSSNRWITRVKTVSSNINAHLWDTTVGAYLDSSNTTGGARHAQDGNSISVLAGVADKSKAQSALQYLSTHNSRFYGNSFYDGALPGVDNATDRVYAFISYFELQARFMTNQPDSALEQIHRMYGWMSNNDPGVTMWEGIGPNGTKYEQGYTSLAHGWSTGIVPLLSNYVLGINPTGPGFETWTVKPYPPSRLSSAKGQVATPRGALTASWQKDKRGKFELNVQAPRGTKGTISVPVGDRQKVFIDGRPVSSPKDAEGYVTVERVKPGSRKVVVV